jgi:hypothetical protein
LKSFSKTRKYKRLIEVDCFQNYSPGINKKRCELDFLVGRFELATIPMPFSAFTATCKHYFISSPICASVHGKEKPVITVECRKQVSSTFLIKIATDYLPSKRFSCRTESPPAENCAHYTKYQAHDRTGLTTSGAETTVGG